MALLLSCACVLWTYVVLNEWLDERMFCFIRPRIHIIKKEKNKQQNLGEAFTTWSWKHTHPNLYYIRQKRMPRPVNRLRQCAVTKFKRYKTRIWTLYKYFIVVETQYSFLMFRTNPSLRQRCHRCRRSVTQRSQWNDMNISADEKYFVWNAHIIAQFSCAPRRVASFKRRLCHVRSV